MRKVKLIVHETYQGKRKSEDVFAAVFLSNAAALTPNTRSGIIKDTERSQDSLCSEKGAAYLGFVNSTRMNFFDYIVALFKGFGKAITC